MTVPGVRGHEREICRLDAERLSGMQIGRAIRLPVFDNLDGKNLPNEFEKPCALEQIAVD